MDQEKEINVIRKWLKAEYSIATRDKTLFEDCKMGRMSLGQCKKQMMKNNDFPAKSDEIVSDESFRVWLNSIGYEVRA